MPELKRILLHRIRQFGPITFEQFMAAALYEPDIGYYTSPETDIGQAADFYTSTNLHGVFGAMFARQAAQMWEHLGRPGDFTFIEQGGGRGLFALDFLEYAAGHDREFYDSLTYLLVELNPHMKARQEKLLSGHSGKLRWKNSLADIEPITGCLFSNELVDSFPVHVVRFGKDGINELYIGEQDGDFKEEFGPCPTPEITEYFKSRSIIRHPGYRTELNLNARKWLREVAVTIKRGYVMTVDYGFSVHDYYSPERVTGTLLCYHRHQTNDEPLKRVGQQDITAHANFTALVEWGSEAGLKPLGFVSQSSFLLNMGIDSYIAELHRALPEDEFLKAAAQVRSLIMPDALGESHKVLVQARNAPDTRNAPLEGLRMRNRLDYLIAQA
ncbi:MAG: SAM-dependent methyltransferase [Nitrospirae bacterium]|nr:SAM-dependent methyltransferase [Nitrospirota bacterium]